MQLEMTQDLDLLKEISRKTGLTVDEVANNAVRLALNKLNNRTATCFCIKTKQPITTTAA